MGYTDGREGMSDLDARTREWYFEAEITMLNMRISELEAENQKIMDRLRYAEIGNLLISSNLKVQSHDELIAITIDKLQTRIKQLEAALEKAAIMAQEKWHSWPAEEISAAIRELKNERKLHKSPPDVFTT